MSYNESEVESLMKKESEDRSDDNSRENSCSKNAHNLIGTALAFGAVISFVSSLASLQMIQVRDLVYLFFRNRQLKMQFLYLHFKYPNILPTSDELLRSKFWG